MVTLEWMHFLAVLVLMMRSVQSGEGCTLCTGQKPFGILWGVL